MKKIVIVVLLLILVIGTLGGTLFYLIQSGDMLTLNLSGDESAEVSGDGSAEVEIKDMYLEEILVRQSAHSASRQYRAVMLTIELSVERDIETARLVSFCVVIHEGKKTYDPSYFRVGNSAYMHAWDADETQGGVGIKLPTTCKFEWKPRWTDGSDHEHHLDEAVVLPPLDTSGLILRVHGLGIEYRVENAHSESEWYSDNPNTSERIFEFELPVLNTLPLHENPDLSEYPVASNIYP